MSMNPATQIGRTADATSAAEPVRPGAKSSRFQDGTAGSRPVSDPDSKQEIATRRHTSQAAELPRDEVQVQRDTESNGQIVIRYLDQSGQVILQVPSSQVLGLARAIEQALEKQAKDRTGKAEAVREGGQS